MTADLGPRFEVRVVPELLVEDIAHSTPAARNAIESMLEVLRKDGAPTDWLRRCEEEGRDGTRLSGCVKLYIPQPAGRWGAVFVADMEAGRPVLVLIAVGERHPERPWRPSVYEIAHRRIHQ